MYRNGCQVAKGRALAVEKRVSALRQALKPALRRHLRRGLLRDMRSLERRIENLRPGDDAAAWLELEQQLEQLEAKLELAVEMGWHVYRSEARGLRFGLGLVACLAGAAAFGLVAHAAHDVVVTETEEVPFSSMLCADTARCGGDSRCVQVAGAAVCRLRSHSDCRLSHACRVQGRCSAVRGYCEATSTPQCRRSELCRFAGRCVAFAGRCVAASDRDCKRSRLCQEEARCRAVEGRCQQSEAGRWTGVQGDSAWSDELDYRLGAAAD